MKIKMKFCFRAAAINIFCQRKLPETQNAAMSKNPIFSEIILTRNPNANRCCASSKILFYCRFSFSHFFHSLKKKKSFFTRFEYSNRSEPRSTTNWPHLAEWMSSFAATIADRFELYVIVCARTHLLTKKETHYFPCRMRFSMEKSVLRSGIEKCQHHKAMLQRISPIYECLR